MLALRRLPRYATRLTHVRGNSTLEAASAQASAPSPPPVTAKTATPPPAQEAASEEPTEPITQTEQTKGKQRKWPTRRPSISLERPREWSRPIAKGVEPAYDYALRYILRDAQFVRKELEELQAKVQAEEAKPEGERDVAALEQLREKMRILEIQSEVNLPDVRWKARNGMADFSKPIYRHLVEQRWREEGDLDLLMERIYQMKVVPDLLPELHPSFDLRIRYLEPPPKNNYLRTRVKRKLRQVEPGIFLLPEQTRRPPEIYTTLFHTDTRLYTLLMVDLDVPNPDTQSFTTYLHWMQPNIPLSAFTTSPTVPLQAHTPYVPPHPHRNTPYHRYVLLVLPQASASEPIDVPVLQESDRLGFDFRVFAAQYGFDGARGGGAHMWREVWDETVSHIYKFTLKQEEPRFGKMPKPDPYAELKSKKKYL
ncbi:PEBP-like protein [Dichomitus squalens]|uniref:PEBP-like protein n=1 Tax=Dichomitus squalens TaxID=114155 RepID=A0A4V2K7I2_9APHY|nr:PEBP-like protein [Dichomitus squalens]TBU56238.1 PEBP-like protein [Dichomitus squalens]